MNGLLTYCPLLQYYLPPNMTSRRRSGISRLGQQVDPSFEVPSLQKWLFGAVLSSLEFEKFDVEMKLVMFTFVYTLTNSFNKMHQKLFWAVNAVVHLVVSMRTFYSYDPSLNPTEVDSFSVQMLLGKNKNNQKEVGVGPLETPLWAISKLDWVVGRQLNRNLVIMPWSWSIGTSISRR